MLWLGGKTSEADLLPEFLPELIQVMCYYGADESWISLDNEGNIVSIDSQAVDLFIEKTVTSRNIDTDIGILPSSLICAFSIEALGCVGFPAIPSLSEAVKNVQFENDKVWWLRVIV